MSTDHVIVCPDCKETLEFTLEWDMRPRLYLITAAVAKVLEAHKCAEHKESR